MRGRVKENDREKNGDERKRESDRTSEVNLRGKLACLTECV